MNFQCFNPEILYAFDVWNQPDNENTIHHHDFFEISIILQGESLYLIDDEWKTVRSGDILLFNPGIDHAEKQLINTYSHQLHIGIKNFKLYGLEKNHFPTHGSLLSMQDSQFKIFDKAWQLIEEFNQQKTHFNLMGRALVMEMMLFILRSLEKEEKLSEEEWEALGSNYRDIAEGLTWPCNIHGKAARMETFAITFADWAGRECPVEIVY